jgi:hypothetical protein
MNLIPGACHRGTLSTHLIPGSMLHVPRLLVLRCAPNVKRHGWGPQTRSAYVLAVSALL